MYNSLPKLDKGLDRDGASKRREAGPISHRGGREEEGLNTYVSHRYPTEMLEMSVSAFQLDRAMA